MSDVILNANQALVVPSGRGSDSPIVLDMRMINKIHSRLEEINTLTKFKANEFLHVVTEALEKTKEYIAMLNLEHLRAKQKLREIRGMLVLEVVPDELKTRNMASAKSPAGSEDLRDSVVNANATYQEAVDRSYVIGQEIDKLDAKAERFKMAYFIAMNVSRGTDFDSGGLSGGTGDEEPGSYTKQEKAQEFMNSVKKNNGFGTAKY